MARPTQQQMKAILDTFDTAEDVDYFFDQLTSPDWIDSLVENGLLTTPPKLIRVDGGVQFPPWSASRYLARIAAAHPEAVRPILLKVADSDNVRVLHDVADAVLDLPPEMAVEFVPKMIGWLDSPYHLLLPEKLGKLACRLAGAGLVDAAVSLAQPLFHIHPLEPFSTSATKSGVDFPTEATSSINHYEFERLIVKCAPEFVAHTGLVGLRLFSDLLATAMEIEGSEEGRRLYKDFSSIWRPSIAPHAQNQIPSVRSTIVSAVHDASIQLVKSSQVTLADMIVLLESKRWSIHRRIALEVLRVAAPRRSALVSERLISTKWMYDVDMHHEYWTLLHERYAALTQKQQDRLLGAIARGPAIYRSPNNPYEGDAQLALECWQARFLAAIAEHLSGENRKWFKRLVADKKLAEHPDFLYYTSSGFAGPVSPISDNKLSAMSEDELISYLSSWEPEPGFAKPSRESLGSTLSAVVRSAPGRFAEHAAKFQSLDPTYVNAILSAFSEVAHNNQGQFPWEPILELSHWVVQQDQEIPGRQTEYDDLDRGWIWTRSTIARLLDAGFNSGVAEIPFKLRKLAWSVLYPLTNDPHPTVEYEEKYGGSNMDPTTLAINTVRGQAIQAVIKFGLWVHRHLGEATTEQSSGPMPEVFQVLDYHVDLAKDPSYAVHSIYGQWIPWLALLDDEWARANLSKIFVPEDDRFLYWEAAWDAYIGFSQPYNAVFELLRAEYHRAIDRLSRASSDRRHPILSQDRLGQHLMVFYLRGCLELDDPLLDSFFALASPELRSNAIRFVGRNLYLIVDNDVRPTVPAPPSEVIDRAKALWAWRLAVANSLDDSSSIRPEIAEFGWWFVAPDFDDDWVLDQLIDSLRLAKNMDADHLTIKRLATLVESRPQPVLDALQLLLRSEHDGWLVLTWKDSVIELLRSALANSDSRVREHAVTLVHDLGAKGYRQFRELLSPSNED